MDKALSIKSKKLERCISKTNTPCVWKRALPRFWYAVLLFFGRFEIPEEWFNKTKNFEKIDIFSKQFFSEYVKYHKHHKNQKESKFPKG